MITSHRSRSLLASSGLYYLRCANQKLGRLLTLVFYAILYLFTCRIALVISAGVSAEEIATAPNYYVVFEESVYFEITWPESLMYTFKLKQAKDFGTVFDKLHEDVELILADPEDACQDLLNEIHGAVVLIRRGECSFLAKSKTAEKAGALAAIIFDNDENNDNSMIEMIDDETHRIVHIPAYFLLGKDGAMIRGQLYMLQTDRALINIPINLTGKPHTAVRRPPWTIW